MIITGTITTPNGEQEHVEAEGETYEVARTNLYTLLAENQKLIAIRTDR